MTTERLREHIEKEIKSEVFELDNTIKIVDFHLVHEVGNYYNGTLTTTENGEKFLYNVMVTYDGNNYKWEIITE